jgi:NCS1 family nucleobase:cation symporter-1
MGGAYLNTTSEKKGFLYDWEKERVPEHMTRHWWELAFIEMGLYASGFGIMMGGLIAGGNWSWYDVLAWFIIGNTILLVFYYLIGSVGVKERLPTSWIVVKLFGPLGAKLFNLILLIGILAWAALGLHQLALAITNFTGVSPYITPIIAALCVLLSATAGTKTITLLSKIAIPFFYALVLLWAIFFGFKVNWNAWGLKQPWGGFWPTWWHGVTFVVGLNIMASFLCPGWARYAKSSKDVFKAASTALYTGMVLLSYLMATFAAYALTPQDKFPDPSLIMMRCLGPVIGLITVVLLIWTTADNDYWYLGLSAVQVYPRLSLWQYVLILMAGSMIIIYGGLLYRYVEFATMLAVIWSSLPGIIIGHYYVLPRLGVSTDIVVERNIKFNVIPFIPWIIGTTVAYYMSQGGLPFPELAAAVTALVVYVALMAGVYGKKR